jgi:Integrase core domain
MVPCAEGLHRPLSWLRPALGQQQVPKSLLFVPVPPRPHQYTRPRGLTVTAASPRWLRDELLDGEIFYSLREAQIIIESWRRHYNTVRPHASLGYQPPAPEVFVPTFAAWPAALPRPAPPARLPVVQRSTLN